jgi:hypothetical protein
MKKLIHLIIIFISLGLCLIGASKPSIKKVYVKTLKNGHYQLMVNNRPFIIKGICYSPIGIGKGYDYDFWSDPCQPWKKDGALMKKMGINTVRFYQPGENFESVKTVVRDLYKLYGVRTMMGHWLEFWNYPAPFYDDPEFRKKVKEKVIIMVNALKDEEGILAWVLGNENNFSFSGKINPWSSDRIDKLGDARQCMLARAESYYTLVNEVSQEIHKIDPNHPVVMGNGELICLDVANQKAPDVDIIGCVIYRGKTFGNIFKSLKATFDKPLIFIEFGSDAYNAYEKNEDEDSQAEFLESQWAEIYKNLAAGLSALSKNNPDGVGNCLGGTMFEWNDEWWKHQESNGNGWSIQDTESNWSNGAYYFDIKAERNMNMNEEWFGLIKLLEEKDKSVCTKTNAATCLEGIDKRVPRKAYYVIREFWKRPHEIKKNSGKKK